MTDIELVDADDVKGRGNAKGIGKYSKYREGLASYMQWFKDEIGKSKEGKIIVKTDDILQVVGNGVGKNPTSVFWGTKYALFQKGMFATQGTHINGGGLIVIRMATEDDILPGTLGETEKNIEKSEE